MNKMELDSFVAEAGTVCGIGGDEKWQNTKVESLITQSVRRQSQSISQTGKSAVRTASFFTTTKDSADVSANCRGVR